MNMGVYRLNGQLDEQCPVLFPYRDNPIAERYHVTETADSVSYVGRTWRFDFGTDRYRWTDGGGRVFLWGDSAGGHLALLAALTGASVAGVVAWFPVTDLAGLPSDVAGACGVPDRGPESREALLLGAPAASVPDLAREASPVSHASAAAPPVLLMHGDADDLVPPAQSIRLAGALRAAGARVELELVPGATHFWKGASDVGGIVCRSVQFVRGLS